MNFAEKAAHDSMRQAVSEIGAHEGEGLTEAIEGLMGALMVRNSHERKGAARAIAERLLADAARLDRLSGQSAT